MSLLKATPATAVRLAIIAIATANIALAQTAPQTQQPTAKTSARSAPLKVEAKPEAKTDSKTDQQAAASGSTAFQTLDQLQRAGVKRCLQTAKAVGQATMTGSSEYAAVSTWNNKQPDNRFSVSMIGQHFAPGQNSTSNGLSGVFSVPTSEGKCDAAAVQIIPTTEPCTSVQAQILQKGRTLGNLAGVPLLQNAANAQVMLLPAANNSCVLVALSTVYTE